MAEGFYAPQTLDLPFNLERVLRSLVRVPAQHQYAVVSMFESQQQKETFVPEQGSKSFLPEGVVLWHLALSRTDLEQIRGDPGLRLRPLLYEAVQAFRDVDRFPSQMIVPLQIAALGVFISLAGYILTNYHVVGEEIEAAGRTEGHDIPHTCRYTAFQTPVVHKHDVSGWEVP